MITHPEKLLFPEDGITKGELAAYYEMVAPIMVPHIRGRPVTMERYPAGIGEKGFFHKDVSRGFPDWLERVEVPKRGGTVRHLLIRDTRSLLWMANQNCITPHVWTRRVPDLDRPDLCVFDLDPSREEPDVLAGAAIGLRRLLEEVGLPTFVKTTGSKGFHIVVPLDGSADVAEASWFAEAIAAILVAREPERLTLELGREERGGRILLDTGRNGYSATFAAPYAVRARPGAPVSAPCTWEELERGLAGPRSFSLRGMRARLERVGDLWGELEARAAPLAPAVERLRAGWPDLEVTSFGSRRGAARGARARGRGRGTRTSP